MNDQAGKVEANASAALIDRRRLLQALGVAGLAVGLDSTVLSGRAMAQPGGHDGAFDPMDLTFSIAEQRRPFDLLAPNFVQLRDSFATAGSAAAYDVLAPSPEENAGSTDFGEGQVRLSGEGFFALLRSGTQQQAPFATVMVDVTSFAGSGGDEDTVLVGLVKDESSYVVGWYNRAAGVAGIDVTIDGTRDTLGTVAADIAAPCRLAFCVTGTTAVVLVDEGDGFRPLLPRNLAGHVDLRQPAALAEYHNGFGARASSGTIVLESVEAGYYGEAGVRDPHVVTRSDGTPYIRDNKVYLTLTQAGLAFFETAHWGVWTLDLASYELEQVANLFFQREGMAAVLGDHAGHVVLDEDNERWILAMSTWGDFTFEGVEVNYVTVPTSIDVLSGVHILQTAPLPLPLQELPTAAVGQWDPHLVRIQGRWYVAFVNARRFFSFYPALARSRPGGDFTDLSLVGADASKNATEGTVMQRFDGEWYLLASNGDDSPAEIRGQYPVYDLTVTQVGTLDAPHPTNIPWPMVFPVPLPRARTRWVMVTFNGTQYYEPVLGYGTHGDFFVMEASPVTRGYEFPPR